MEDTDNNSSEQKKGFVFNFDKYFLPLSILVASVIISGAILYAIGNNDSSGIAQIARDNQDLGAGNVAEASVDDDPMLGNENAKVTIIEFSDYQCPFCRSFWRDSLPQIKEKYIDSGQVKFVYRDFPLSIHPEAEISALAAECANDQGKYWEYHDKLFQEQDKQGTGTVRYTSDDLKRWAVETGLNDGQFNSCLDSGNYRDEVAKDFSDGQASGVSGTPTFFINGRRLVGAQPFANFQSVIEEELSN